MLSGLRCFVFVLSLFSIIDCILTAALKTSGDREILHGYAAAPSNHVPNSALPYIRKWQSSAPSAPKLPLHHNCTNATECIANSECSTTNGTCVCTTNYYEKSGACVRKIAPGQRCLLETTDDNPCVKGAVCHEGRCACVNGQANPSSGTCTVSHGQVGSKCNSTTCQGNTTCSSNSHCECKQGFYQNELQCIARLPLDHACVPERKINPCITDAVCVNYRCECESGFYRTGDGACATAITYNETCNMSIADPKQCDNGTKCMYGADDQPPKCSCGVDYFFNGAGCFERARALSPCVPGQGAEQCVDNAACVGDTGLCECNTGYYTRSGRCPKRIEEGKICDPWSHNPMQCVHGHSCIFGQCVADTGLPLDHICFRRRWRHNPCSANARCIMGRCACAAHAFRNGNICTKTVLYNDVCNISITDHKQCGNHTKCLYIAKDNQTKCGCDDKRYFDGEKCARHLPLDYYCHNETTTNPCRTYAECINSRCTCVKGTIRDHNICRQNGSTQGTPCDDSEMISPCGSKAKCINNTGTCRDNSVSSNNYPAIAGAVAGAVVLIIAVVIAVHCCRMQQRKEAEEMEMKEVAKQNTTLNQTMACTRISLLDFADYLKYLYEDSGFLLAQQFQGLRSTNRCEFTTKAAMDFANRDRNRYLTALPYDHTRVEVSDPAGERKKYINASYIEGFESVGHIATQAPLPSTTADFWRMVFEQRSGVIVMLADPVEDGRVKVDQYWPEELHSPVNFGEVEVELTSAGRMNGFLIRQMILSMSLYDPLHVTHLHVPGWWKEGVSTTPELLADFVSVVHQAAPSNEGPITVHCSAGVGRTGIFIAVDILATIVETQNCQMEVDVFSLVQTMMSCRPDIIQTQDQYMFVHEVLRVMVDRKIQRMQRMSARHL